MRNIVTGLASRIRRHPAGFTLVELLIVVGIIVALSAAIVPAVSKFANRGDTAAMASEKQSVQAAIDNMMADKAIDAVTALASPGTSTQNFASLPSEGALTGYLRNNPTKYYYCWSTAGQVTLQSAASTVCP